MKNGIGNKKPELFKKLIQDTSSKVGVYARMMGAPANAKEIKGGVANGC